MKAMLGRSSGGGLLWNKVPLQGGEAERAMPLFRSRRAHLAQTAALPTPAVRLEVVGRTTGFRQATSRVVLWAASSATPPPPLRYEPASDALDEPSPSSLRAHLAKPVVRNLQGVGRTAHLTKPALSRMEGVGRMSFGKPAAVVRWSPGHLKGAALGDLLICYASSEPPSDPLASSLNDKLDHLRGKLDLFQCKLDHLCGKLDLFQRKFEDTMSMKTLLKRLIWLIFTGLVLVLCIVLAVGALYHFAGGRRYVEVEMSRVMKTILITVASDAEVRARLDKLVRGRIDNTFAYISSAATWYKWLFGM